MLTAVQQEHKDSSDLSQKHLDDPPDFKEHILWTEQLKLKGTPLHLAFCKNKRGPGRLNATVNYALY